MFSSQSMSWLAEAQGEVPKKSLPAYAQPACVRNGHNPKDSHTATSRACHVDAVNGNRKRNRPEM